MPGKKEWGMRWDPKRGLYITTNFDGVGHRHEETAATKEEARERRATFKGRVRADVTWCPLRERHALLEAERAKQRAQDARVGFSDYALKTYEPRWGQSHKSGQQQHSTIVLLARHFGETKLDSITREDVERYLRSLKTKDGLAPAAPATVNRRRAVLAAILNAAVEEGRASSNPAKVSKRFPKAKEPAGRVVYLLPAHKSTEESTLWEALPVDLRPAFTVAMHTGLRRGELLALRWRSVDFYTRRLRVEDSKSGRSREVPLNDVALGALKALSTARSRPNDPSERVIHTPFWRLGREFPKAVERARKALVGAGEDASRLAGFVWHSLRHTMASRLVMAGVDLFTVQQIMGWESPEMVQRYAHLSPAHLDDAVARLVGPVEVVGVVR